MADNFNLVEALGPPAGTQLRVMRAIELTGGVLAQAAVLLAADGTTLIGQKARTASLPTTLSSEDVALIGALATNAKAEEIRALLAGTLAVSAASLPLPTGAATQTTLAAVLSALQGIVSVRGATRTLTNTTGQVTASGDTTIIAAPGAGQRLVIADMQIQSESATAVTVLIRRAATTIRRIRLAADADGLALALPVGHEIRLSDNEALILNLSTAATVGYTFRTFTEVV